MTLAFDHLLLATHDLEAAGERLLADHGLASLPGGRHTGHGTANRIVPLGPDYLELITVVDAAEAADSPVGRWIERGLDAAGDEPWILWGWNLRTDDADAVAERLGLEVLEFSRRQPDGNSVHFRLVGLEGAVGPDELPFFGEHAMDENGAPGPHHPGRQRASHRVRPEGIAWVQVGGDEDRLRRWIGPEMGSLDVRAVAGPPGLRRAAVATAKGDLILGAG